MSHGCGRQTLNDKINMNTETNDGNGKEQQTLAPAGLLDAPESKREKTNRQARERRARRKSYNSGSKADRLDAYSWCS